jgi:hypothetical protein
MQGYDVEHWVTLHRDDPNAFDAARQTVIALELARVRPEFTGPARRLLERLRADAEGVGHEQRLRRSALYMIAALAQMARALEELGEAGENNDSISRRRR